MRVLLLGDNASIHKLTCSVIPGLELTGVSDLSEAMDILTRDSIDLVMVSNLKEDATECCEWIKESCDVPVTLIVREKDINWREINYLIVDGFIPENSTGEELKARLNAISRRCHSTGFQANHIPDGNS